MTMATRSSVPKQDDLTNQFKVVYEYLKEIYEPSPKAKPKQDLSATIYSPHGSNFRETLRAISQTIFSEMMKGTSMDPTKSKYGDKEGRGKASAENQQWRAEAERRTGSGGTRAQDKPVDTERRTESGDTHAPDKFKRTENKSSSQGQLERTTRLAEKDEKVEQKGPAKRHLSEDERSQELHKTCIPVKLASSSTKTSDYSQMNTDVDEGSVNQPHGGQLAKQKNERDDEGLEKLAADKQKEVDVLQHKNIELNETNFELQGKLEQAKTEIMQLNQQYNGLEEEKRQLETRCTLINTDLQKQIKTNEDLLQTRNDNLAHILKLDSTVKKYAQVIEENERTIQTLTDELENRNRELTDLKNRFSKLAGHKLTDQNPDIADLSDPNRAMKLSEKFGALYDDTWTDAFEHLTGDCKLKPNDAIQFLLDRLKDCWDLCQTTAETWMTSLQQVFLHPIQETAAVSKLQGVKQGPRLGSKDLRVIRDARRQVGSAVGMLVKQHFMLKLKKEHQKLNEVCKPYLEGCVDVCWLMVLAEPPLHIDFSVKQGERFDPNRYSAHSNSGGTVEFLVWPPLYNAAEGGGLLSKGTVSTERKVGKDKK